MSIIALALILIGVITLAIAVILLVIHRDNRQWWMWALLLISAILLLLGFALYIYGWYQGRSPQP